MMLPFTVWQNQQQKMWKEWRCCYMLQWWLHGIVFYKWGMSGPCNLWILWTTAREKHKVEAVNPYVENLNKSLFDSNTIESALTTSPSLSLNVLQMGWSLKKGGEMWD